MVSGSSAGGFGSAINYWRVKEGFGDVRVDLLDDSGPPFEQQAISLFPQWKQAWNMDPAFPPGCPECRSNIRAVSPYYSRTYPSSRFALLSYDHDETISLSFLMIPFAFHAGLLDIMENTIKPLPNMRYFIVPGSTHTLLGDLSTKSEGVALTSWLAAMVTDPGSGATWRRAEVTAPAAGSTVGHETDPRRCPVPADRRAVSPTSSLARARRATGEPSAPGGHGRDQRVYPPDPALFPADPGPLHLSSMARCVL